MLVLRRREGESVLIGDSIEVEVVEITAGKVKLGIKAPDDIFILRKEVQLAEQANLAAARGTTAEAIQYLVTNFRHLDR